MNNKIKDRLKNISTDKLLDLSCLIVRELRIRDWEERNNIQEALEMLEMCWDL
jgi:hypothetical protein